MKAKKQASTTAPQPQPPAPAQAPVAAPAQAAPSKQEATLTRLKEAWTARGVSLEAMEVKQDGKFLFVTVAPNWPVIRIGSTGGLELPTIRSFAKAFDAAVHGDELLAKQTARDAKKAAQATAAPKAEAVKPEVKPEVKKESTTAKKAKQAEKVEAQLLAKQA